MFCISCSQPLDGGVIKLAKSLNADRVICANCMALYAERAELVQMNVRIPVTLDAQLREASEREGRPYARVVRDALDEYFTARTQNVTRG